MNNKPAAHRNFLRLSFRVQLVYDVIMMIILLQTHSVPTPTAISTRGSLRQNSREYLKFEQLQTGNVFNLQKLNQVDVEILYQVFDFPSSKHNKI